MTRPAGDSTTDRHASGFGQGEATDGEMVEAARQMAAIADAGLPLATGLEALAEELPRSSGLRSMLERVAQRIEDGESLEEALDAEGSRFPAPLRGLLTAGVRSGRLAGSLGRFLDLYEMGHTLRRQLWLSLIYPTILILAAFAMFVGASIVATQEFEAIFLDFGMTLPWITVIMLKASKAVVKAGGWLALGPVVGVALTWVTMRLTMGAAERVRMLHWLPLIGPLARNTALAQFCPVLSLMVESDVPLPEALRLAGDSSRDAGMAQAARVMAEGVEQGKSLGETVENCPPFPRGFGAFLSWAENHRGLVESLNMAAETFEANARAQAAFIAKFCNVVSMVVVLWWVGLTVVALFLPLIALLYALGGTGPAPGASEWMWILTLALLGGLGVAGLAGVFALVWPLMRRGPAFVARPARDVNTPRPRFWYFAPAGWALLGATILSLLLMRLMNALGAGEWLPEWWLLEVWPLMQMVGLAVAMVAVLMVIFEFVAARVERERANAADRASRPVRRSRFRFPTITFGLRHVMFAMAPLAVFFVMAKEMGWSILWVILLLSPPVAVVSVFVILSSRRTINRDGLLRVMAMASRRGQPLATAIRAFAQTCPRRYRRKLERLASRMDEGDSLPQALETVPGALTPSGLTVVTVGCETGTLSRTLDDALEASASRRAARIAAVGTVGYPLMVLAAIVGIGLFMLLHVSSQLGKVFQDFDVAMPEPSRTILTFAQTRLPAVQSAELAALLSGVVAISIIAAGLIGWGLIRKAQDWIPLGDRLMRRLHTAVILRALAAGIETGQPLPTILSRMASAHPRRWARRRLRRSVARLESGEDWPESLRDEGLITRVDCALIRSAEHAGNLPWALREVAGSGERRFTYRLQAIGQVLQPLVIVAMGMFVLLFALTYFRPLVTMLDSLAEVDL